LTDRAIITCKELQAAFQLQNYFIVQNL